MMMIKFLLILPLFLFFGCSEPTTKDKTADEQKNDSLEKSTTQEKEAVTKKAQEPTYLVEENRFYGVEVGQNIEDILAEKPDLLKKGVYQSGEGNFDIYQIMENEEKLADIFFLEKDGKKKIGSIVITAEKAYTAKGIKIGSSYQEVMQAYPKAKVHGSEIEGYTHAFVGGFAFLLDINIWKYEISETIPPNTKVIAIDIRGAE